MRRGLAASLIVLGCALPSSAGLALGPEIALSFQSGSESGGQSGSTEFPRPQRDPTQEAYSRGKFLVSKRIACKKCAYPTGVKDAPTAQKVATQVRAGEFELKPNERELVLLYLLNRFGA